MRSQPRSLPSLFALSALAGLVHAEPLNLDFPEQPPQNATSIVVYDNFVGISFELSSFDTLWGATTDSLPEAIQNYLHNLNARFQHPLRIRVGGNGMDGSTYVPEMTDVMLNLTDPEAYFNDIPVDFGPVLFDVMNEMSDNVGDMQFLVGLSMRDPSLKDNVIALAKDAESKLGNRLDAMLLGNEPDLYAGHGERDTYEISDYIPEITDMSNSLKDQGLLQEPLLGGPTVCCSWNLDEVIDAGMGKLDYKYYTLQHYPQHACQGPTEKNTNISYFLTHSDVGDFVNWNERGIELAKRDNIPVLLTELNSVACGGSNISDTLATALWTIDVSLKSAAQNFSGVYMHTREYNVQYNLFEPRVEGQSSSRDWRTGSTYFTTLVMSEVMDSAGSVVVDHNLNNSDTNPEAKVAAYQVYDNGGSTRGKYMLINYASVRDGAPETQEFKIPAGISNQVKYRVLTGSDDEREFTPGDRMTWAGQWVGENGVLEGEQTTVTLQDCYDNGCTVQVPSPGLALVLVDENLAFYEGNSTLTGQPAPGDDNASIRLGLSSTWLLAVVAFVGAWIL